MIFEAFFYVDYMRFGIIGLLTFQYICIYKYKIKALGLNIKILNVYFGAKLLATIYPSNSSQLTPIYCATPKVGQDRIRGTRAFRYSIHVPIYHTQQNKNNTSIVIHGTRCSRRSMYAKVSRIPIYELQKLYPHISDERH